MFRLLVLLLLFLLSPAPAFAAGACEAPQPNSAQVKQWIKEAQKRGGAAAQVPAKVLEAIYVIEATTAYTDPSYNCQRNPNYPQVLGLMQIKDDIYKTVVPQNQQIADEGVCQETNCKLSRCNAVDAIEIAARVLLKKIYLWDDNQDKPLGKLDSKDDAYYASCRYYGIFDPDDFTTALSDWLSPSQIPADGTLTYCEFVCAYSGKCSSANDYPARSDIPYSGNRSNVNFTFDACTTPIISPPPLNFTTHPLRPFPDEAQTTDKLTTYCAMRPLPVEQNRFDKREQFIDIKTQGKLTQDFTNFITPLLSITDPKKSDYSLPYNDKAQRYLADYLEGRAYYEPFVESPDDPDFLNQLEGLLTNEEIAAIHAYGIDNIPDSQLKASIMAKINSGFMFNRLGVFRKLSPASYQDELKRAIIERATNGMTNNPYGFDPASATVHNYSVGFAPGPTATLAEFAGNWAPLPKDYPDGGYEAAYEAWKNSDGGKWYKLWPYMPMFTREDTIGKIKIIDSNSPPNQAPYYSGADYIEKNQSDPKEVEVSHPHLARTYEVATSLSYLLTPQEVHETAVRPQLSEEWITPLWEGPIWWLDPSYIKPHPPQVLKTDVVLGPLCDVDPSVINLISSSGDTASDDIITTSVNRQDLQVPNPEYPPGPASAEDAKNCGAKWDCETCKETPIRDPLTHKIIGYDYTLDESACFYYKRVRSDPNYLITYTPFLNEILTSLSGSQRAVFDLFKPAGLEKKPYEEFDWPGVGGAGEESPVYDFTPDSGENGWGEAGARKPRDSQSYYYRYLGNIQCAKERVMQVLQPFISGENYKPYAYDCFPELTPPTPNTNVPGNETPPGGGTFNDFPYPPNLTGIAGICPNGGEEITDKLASLIPEGTIRLLPNSNGARSQKWRLCIKPTMIIVHWSGGHDNADGNERTYETLIARDLACQLATDTDDVYLMQPFYETQVEMAWCANSWNTYSINNEMAGINFKSPIPPPNSQEFKRAVDTTCEIMKQYYIPWYQIFGHYQVPGMLGIKDDPGEEFLQKVFIPRVKGACGGSVATPM